jgi:hypothetical protein
VVAILVGWLLGNEELTLWIIGGMVIILAGVALVRSGSLRARWADSEAAPPAPRPRRVPAELAPADCQAP